MDLYMFTGNLENHTDRNQRSPHHALPIPVSQFPAAPSAAAVAHFEALMGFETDFWDVHHAMTAEAADFVLLDVRAPALFAAGHVPGDRKSTRLNSSH